MWEGLSGGCRAGVTLKRCSQLATFAIQPVGLDAAAVWLAEDACSQVRASSESQFGVLRGGWRHARGRKHCREEPRSALSGGYAPDSAKAEGSSIVDEAGEG